MLAEDILNIVDLLQFKGVEMAVQFADFLWLIFFYSWFVIFFSAYQWERENETLKAVDV